MKKLIPLIFIFSFVFNFITFAESYKSLKISSDSKIYNIKIIPDKPTSGNSFKFSFNYKNLDGNYILYAYIYKDNTLVQTFKEEQINLSSSSGYYISKDLYLLPDLYEEETYYLKIVLKNSSDEIVSGTNFNINGYNNMFLPIMMEFSLKQFLGLLFCLQIMIIQKPNGALMMN